jgi:mannose-6-phosphate isomerase-like protein (cupin superfamily)
MARDLDPFDFRELAPFNDSAFCMYYGDRLDQLRLGARPDTDELLMVLDGSVTVEILTDSDRHVVPLTAGKVVVVPKDHWHRHSNVGDVVEMFFPPAERSDTTCITAVLD